MRVSIPHRLSRAEVRSRLHAHAHELAGSASAEVTTQWVDEDNVVIEVSAMGQNLDGDIAITDSEVIVTLDLPMLMSFAEPMISGAIREKAQALLA